MEGTQGGEMSLGFGVRQAWAHPQWHHNVISSLILKPHLLFRVLWISLIQTTQGHYEMAMNDSWEGTL